MDAFTTELVKEWIAKYDDAVANEDLEQMSYVVDCICSSPNRPFRTEVLRQLGMD